jgi:CubicO group peptidase (beta-lactamase class C family)
VIEHGRLAFAHGVGVKRWEGAEEVTDLTAFKIGSISKPLTAAMVMTLVDDGTVDLRAPITTYAPYFGVRTPFEASTITMHHLLSHTAGYPNDFPAGVIRTCTPYGAAGLPQAFMNLADVPLWFAPGTMWNYSNNGYSAVALVAQEAAHEYYVDLMRTRVFAPIGMTSTTFYGDEAAEGDYATGHELRGTARPMLVEPSRWDCAFDHPQSTTLWSTAVDLARFGVSMMHDGRGLMTAASARAMNSTQATPTDVPGTSYGYGMELETYKGYDVLTHGGSTRGYSAMLWLVPSEGFGVAVVVNSQHGGTLAAWRATDVFLGLPEENPPRAALRPIDEWAKYVGTYRESSGTLGDVTVELGAGRLYATNTTIGGRVELRGYGPDMFVPASGPWMYALTMLFSFDRPDDPTAARIGTRVGVAMRAP